MHRINEVRPCLTDIPGLASDYDDDYRPRGGSTDIGADEYYGDGTAPLPDIRANDSDGPVSLSAATPLTFTLGLKTGTYVGKNSDWWLGILDPQGAWVTYTLDGGWAGGTRYGYKGTLFEVSGRQIESPALTPGEYQVYFAVDVVPDGQLNMDSLWYDSVSIVVE